MKAGKTHTTRLRKSITQKGYYAVCQKAVGYDGNMDVKTYRD